jgi:hypothetical protein
MADQPTKRGTAYKLKIGDILKSNQIFEDLEGGIKRFKQLELGEKIIQRVNIIANIIDKYESETESKFALVGEDLNKFKNIQQGDTIVIIGVLRSFNQELYILPEVIKKQDPKYLLVRKLEIEKAQPIPVTTEEKQEIKAHRDDVIDMIKAAEPQEGINKDEIINKLKNGNPEIISQEIQKLLEEGVIYEPKPGRVRYLG